MSDLHKSKRHDPIDMFSDNSRYLDDLFTIHNPKNKKYNHQKYIHQKFS